MGFVMPTNDEELIGRKVIHRVNIVFQLPECLIVKLGLDVNLEYRDLGNGISNRELENGIIASPVIMAPPPTPPPYTTNTPRQIVKLLSQFTSNFLEQTSGELDSIKI
jgi:hypothetical protein